MGLDITTYTTAADVLAALAFDDCGVKEIAYARKLFVDLDGIIKTRPGSYSGLHRVRAEYAKLKGWPLDHDGKLVYSDGGAWEGSHLCNHSDAYGWYLPLYCGGIICGNLESIASSASLFLELEELLPLRDTWDEPTRWAFKAVYIAAVASVVCQAPIKFH